MQTRAVGCLAVVMAFLLGCDQPDPLSPFDSEPVPSILASAYPSTGDVLVSEISSGTIRHISADGLTSSIFHAGVANPRGIAIEKRGTVVVVELAGNLRRIAADGTTSSVFVLGAFTSPSGVAVLPDGDLIVTEDHSAGRLWRVAPDGSSLTVLASGIKSEAVEVAPSGDIFVVQELAGGQLLQVSLGPPVAVSVLFGGLNAPSDLAIEGAGDFVVAEFGSSSVRRISSDGTTSSLVSAGLASLEGIEVAFDGDLLVSQLSLGRLTRVSPDGSSSSVFFSGLSAPDQFAVVNSTVVVVDIKPGSDPNSINLRSRGVIPVAVLTTDHFDATTVDPTSVQFGPAAATEDHSRGHIEDVDGDGDGDMVLHFRIQETGIEPDATEACLTGDTTQGTPIKGCDAVKIVG